MIKIVTDSSCDLPRKFIEKHDINVVPLTVNIDGVEYTEGKNITPELFWEKMRNSRDLPKTSQPTPVAFSEAFTKLAKDGDDILCLTISSKLSGTFQSASLGNQLAGNPASIFDTLSGSLSHGIQVLQSARMAEKGESLENILKYLEIFRKKVTILILLHTLENIVKGGRLSRFKGGLAKLLNVKVILQGVKGEVHILKKIRGTKRFLNETLKIIEGVPGIMEKKIFGITHVDNSEDAEFFKKEILKRFNPKEIIINGMGPTIGTYAGEGGIVVGF
ncbi:MAG: DegV family protein [Thermotogota bacterium]|nr:DegV family protein [Thermotogota bacterium]